MPATFSDPEDRMKCRTLNNDRPATGQHKIHYAEVLLENTPDRLESPAKNLTRPRTKDQASAELRAISEEDAHNRGKAEARDGRETGIEYCHVKLKEATCTTYNGSRSD